MIIKPYYYTKKMTQYQSPTIDPLPLPIPFINFAQASLPPSLPTTKNNIKYYTITKKDSTYNVILSAALEDAKHTSQDIHITYIEIYSHTLKHNIICLQNQKPINLHMPKNGFPTKNSTINSLTTFGKPHSSHTPKLHISSNFDSLNTWVTA